MVRRGTLVLLVSTLIGSVTAPGWAGPDMSVRDSIAGAPPAVADGIDDFDGDGLADVAIGVTGEDPGGAVQVIYGGDTFGPDDEIWTQDSPGIQGASEEFDEFGSALAIGDFDGDGWDDLAVGVPNEDIGSVVSGGAVNVLYGGNDGLTSTGNQLWTQNSSGIEGAVEAFDSFGPALTVGDVDGGGDEGLAVGVPGEDGGGDVSAGAVNVIYGSSSGLSSTDNLIWHQDRGSIKDSAESNDNFGWSLAAGNFNGTTYDDLAVGVPFETLGSRIEAGAVNVIYGSANGLVDQMNQLWTQDSSGVQGAAENLDLFGWSLAAANFGVSTFDDLAIGVPDESIGSISSAGAVNVLYGSESAGLTSAGNQLWDQAVSDVEGAAEQ